MPSIDPVSTQKRIIFVLLVVFVIVFYVFITLKIKVDSVNFGQSQKTSQK